MILFDLQKASSIFECFLRIINNAKITRVARLNILSIFVSGMLAVKLPSVLVLRAVPAWLAAISAPDTSTAKVENSTVAQPMAPGNSEPIKNPDSVINSKLIKAVLA